MGYEVFVFNKYGHEIDFLAQKDGKEYLIQAAYSIAEEKTYQREFAEKRVKEPLTLRINDDRKNNAVERCFALF